MDGTERAGVTGFLFCVIGAASYWVSRVKNMYDFPPKRWQNQSLRVGLYVLYIPRAPEKKNQSYTAPQGF